MIQDPIVKTSLYIPRDLKNRLDKVLRHGERNEIIIDYLSKVVTKLEGKNETTLSKK